MKYLYPLLGALPCAHCLSLAGRDSSSSTIHISGHIEPDQIFSFVYAPFNVTSDVTSITVYQNYSYSGAGNSLDLGIFGPQGTGAINAETGFSGSRGWSGGFRNNFTISTTDATPGYNAGPISPGEWNVVLGPYATNRSGIDWTLDIVLDTTPNATLWSTALAPLYKGPLSEPTWLRGDFHMHSIYSDGRYLPSEQIANALSRDLDFIFFSEHNTDTGNNNIRRWIPENANDLLICRAIEVTTRHGHWQAIGLERTQQVEWRYTNASDDCGYIDAAQQVKNSGGIVSINHPYVNCSRCDWTLSWSSNDAIEVWNGRWDPTDQLAVNKWQEILVEGRRIVALGGSDAHSYPDINGLPTSVVRTEREKSQTSVLDGVRRGHVYLVEGPGMEIEFWVEQGVTRWEMGDVAGKATASSAKAIFVGKGFDGAVVAFVNDRGYFHNESIVEGAQVTVDVAKAAFIRVEVRNSTDTLLGLTNPVFFN